MITFTQVLVLAACSIGLFAFIFVNWFTYRRLRFEQRRAEAEKIERPAGLGLADQGYDQTPGRDIDLQQRDQALFYMHQEQVRKIFDAKLEIIKSAADAQHKISVIQAEVLKLKAEKDFKLLEDRSDMGDEEAMVLIGQPAASVENLPSTVDSDDSGNGVANLPANVNDYERMMQFLAEQQERTKVDVQSRLDELDAQLRALPGQSVDRWVKAQTDSTEE